MFAAVVSHDRPDQVSGCLRSLLRQQGMKLNACVFDSGSDRGCIDRIRTAAGSVRVFEVDDKGFGAACNEALRKASKAGCRHILLSNADVSYHPAALSRLHAALSDRPDAAAASPLIFSAAFPHRIDSFGIIADGRTGRVKLSMHGRLLPDGFVSGGPVEMPALQGASILLEVRAALDAGGFLEEYFMYFEDVEFCFRLRERTGRRLLAVPSAWAWHGGAGSFGPGELHLRHYYAARNHLAFMATRRGAVSAGRKAAILSGHFAQAIGDGSGVRGLRAAASGFADFQAGRTGKRGGAA